VIEVDEGLGRPQPRAHLVPRNSLAWTFQHDGKNLERLILDFYLAAIATQFTGA
jgi:hypothetical protein